MPVKAGNHAFFCEITLHKYSKYCSMWVGRISLRVMIHISKPYKEEREGRVYLVSKVKDETHGWNEELWFSVTPEYRESLCDDYADSFLLLTLLPAIKSGQDIRVEAPVSRRLLFNIRNTIQPIFARMMGKAQIRIEAEPSDAVLYHGKGVGCGCSLGVDSMSSFLRHFGQEGKDGYHVTHLTLFNSGQLGSHELKSAAENFARSVERLKPFSEAVGLPICAVDSNLNSYYLANEVTLLHSFVLRTCACAMALQKLFGNYVYASSYAVHQFQFSGWDASHMESAYAPMCSTENFTLILSNPEMTRVEKTDYIRKWPHTPEFLQVCWAEQMAYDHLRDARFLEGKVKTNCGWCGKCMRTLLTLEILQGDISMYGDEYDLGKYHAHKDEYVARVFAKSDRNVFFRELEELILKTGMPLPPMALKVYRKRKLKAKVKRVLGKPAALLRKVWARLH